MTDPGPNIVTQWISQEIENIDYISLSNVLEITLGLHLKERSVEQIAELAEQLEPAVIMQLHVLADEQISNGVEPQFLLEGEVGTCYIRAVNREVTRIQAAICQLNGTEFEEFCSKILNSLGAKSMQVKGGPGDGGVDFTARDLPVSSCTLPALTASYPIVIGQAKCYRQDRLISLDQLRGFLGAAVVLADKIRREEERIGLFSPIIFAFWTTSDFLPSARDFAREAGIWCLGGLAIAQLTLNLQLEPSLRFGK